MEIGALLDEPFQITALHSHRPKNPCIFYAHQERNSFTQFALARELDL